MPRRSRGLLSALFLFLWALVAAGFAISALVTGEFRYGRRHGITIRPSTHPYFYWFFLSFWFVMSLVVAYLGYRELNWWREQRQARRQTGDDQSA